MFYKAALKCQVVDNFLGFIAVFWRFMAHVLAFLFICLYISLGINAMLPLAEIS